MKTMCGKHTEPTDKMIRELSGPPNRYPKNRDRLRDHSILPVNASIRRVHLARFSMRVATVLVILVTMGSGCQSKQGTGREHFEKGWLYAEKGWWDQAVTEFKEAVRLDPSDAKARHSLGVAFARKSVWNLALAEFKEAVRLEPTLPQAHYGLGVAYVRNSDHSGALEQYNWLKDRSPFLAARLLNRMNGKWSNDVDAGNRP